MKGLKLIGLAGLALCFILGVASAQAEEVSIGDLQNQLAKVRDEGKWEAVMILSDQILARNDASRSTRAMAKLRRVDALAGLKNPPEKIAAEFVKLETDPDFVDLWPIHLRLAESNWLASCAGYEEKGVKAADEGIALVRKEMEKNAPKSSQYNYMWDRMFLIVHAKIKALYRLDNEEDAADVAYSSLKEADGGEVGLRFGDLSPVLDATRNFPKWKQNDKFFESAIHALGITGRTGSAAEVSAAIARMSGGGIVEAKPGADPAMVSKLKESLLAVERIDFKDKDNAANAIHQAKGLAGKL